MKKAKRAPTPKPRGAPDVHRVAAKQAEQIRLLITRVAKLEEEVLGLNHQMNLIGQVGRGDLL